MSRFHVLPSLAIVGVLALSAHASPDDVALYETLLGAKGLPVFDADGKPLGVFSHQKGSEGVDEEGGGGPGGLIAALGGASEGSCLLPLDAVLKILEQARKRIPDAVAKAKEAAAKEKEKDAAKESPKEPAMDGAVPVAPETPDAPKPPEPIKPEQPK